MTQTINDPRTDWLKNARFGVCMHFLPGDANQLALVEKFDAPALAKQLNAMGAKYLLFTLGQNSGFINAPNAEYDSVTGYLPGERCSERDLPMDLAAALAPYGIRLMLYLPAQTPNRDARAQRAFGLQQGPADQPIDPVFARKWAAVIGEWTNRYDSRVSGWWFDGCYTWVHFIEEIAEIYRDAVRLGNPRAIATFNPGVKLIRWTQAEDYTAGELDQPLEVVPTGRWLDGAQWHALTYIGTMWGHRDTRYTDTQWAEWARKVAAGEGAITLDMGPNWDPNAGPIGALAPAQVAQGEAIGKALRH